MRKLYPRKISIPESSKEQEAINEMFHDDLSVDTSESESSNEGTVRFPLSTKDEEIVDSYEATTYDFFTEEETGNLWSEKAEEYAKLIRKNLVSTMAFLDASKSVEEHMSREMHTSLGLLDKDMVSSITYLLRLKLFNLVANDLDFTPEEAEIIFFKEVEAIKGKGPVKSLVNMLKSAGVEENPYGESAPIGMSRKRREYRDPNDR